MFRPVAALCAALWLAVGVRAQEAPARPLVVMNLAAHPDDEDGLTMAYYRGHEGAAVYSVLYTRGEGGQNEAGPDLYERLGAVRTAETERAARILGTEVHYLNRYDFGFSKHAWEAFAEWSRPRTSFWDASAPVVGTDAGREAVTAQLVALIRRLKPDVLFTNHDTTTVGPSAQHGHHQAVGISAVDAFALAADPSYHPEQLAEPGVDLWQPKRLFLRRGGWEPTRPDRADVAVPVADTCAAHAFSPAEACADRAVRAAAQHVSQGFDVFAPRFRRDSTYFVLLRSAPGTPPLPPGATDLAVGLAPHDGITLPPATLVATGRATPLAGLVASAPAAQPGQSVTLTWTPTEGTLRLPALAGGTRAVDARAGTTRFTVPGTTDPTLPAQRQQYARETSTPPLLYTVADAAGAVTHAGFVPLGVAPGVVVDLAPSPIRLTAGVNRIPVTIRTTGDVMTDTLTLQLSVLDADRTPIAFTAASVPAGDTLAEIAVTLPAGVAAGPYRVAVEERPPGGCGRTWYREERPAAVLPDVAVAPGLRVGFVRSYDGTTARALAAMGADVVELDSLALARGAFDGLHTVVVDIRAYLDRPDLVAHNDRLLDWVRRGGHLVVGYHKTFEWNPAEEAGRGLAPVPLVLSRDRVTMEDAPVTVRTPDALVFQRPHAIVASDWDGWVQERGLYFPADDTDARYERLVQTGDTGEAPLTTGLLLAHVGRGTYVYSALGWYRQLEALNPGAWRIVANLVSLPLVDGRDAVGTR